MEKAIGLEDEEIGPVLLNEHEQDLISLSDLELEMRNEEGETELEPAVALEEGEGEGREEEEEEEEAPVLEEEEGAGSDSSGVLDGPMQRLRIQTGNEIAAGLSALGCSGAPTEEFFVDVPHVCCAQELCPCLEVMHMFKPEQELLWMCAQWKWEFSEPSFQKLVDPPTHPMKPPIQFANHVMRTLHLFRTNVPCISRAYWDKPGVRRLVGYLVMNAHMALVSLAQSLNVPSADHKAALLEGYSESWHVIRLVVAHLWFHLPTEEVDTVWCDRGEVARRAGERPIANSEFAEHPLLADTPTPTSAAGIGVDPDLQRTRRALHRAALVFGESSQKSLEWKINNIVFQVNVLFQCFRNLLEVAIVKPSHSMCFVVEVARFVKRVFSGPIVLFKCEPEYMDTLRELAKYACKMVDTVSLATVRRRVFCTREILLGVYRFLVVVWEAISAGTVAFAGGAEHDFAHATDMPSYGPKYMLWELGGQVELLKTKTELALGLRDGEVVSEDTVKLRVLVSTFGYLDLGLARGGSTEPS
jgi:hypothetical protein